MIITLVCSLCFQPCILLAQGRHPWISLDALLYISAIGFFITLFILGLFLQNNYKNKRLNKLLLEKKQEIERQSAILEVKNQELMLKNTIVENLNKEIRKKNKKLEIQNQKIIRQRNMLLKQNKRIAQTKIQLEKAVEELKQVNSNLDKKIQQRTWKIKRTNEKLTKANKELDLMVYSTWHDFRSPITSLLGLVELARLDVQHEQAQMYFTQMLHILKKADRTLAKIRMLSIVSRKSSVYFFENIMIDEVIEELKARLDELAKTNQVQLFIENTVKKPFPSDFDTLSFLLENLIENAIIFKTDDPQKVPTVQVNIDYEANKYIIIRVQDNGIGIAESIKDKVCDLLFRGSEKSEGSGMGLYIVQIAVEKMQGELNIQSEEGIGTIITCRLPIRSIDIAEEENINSMPNVDIT